ncbi:MAG: 4Fe-4S binding protein [Candidatus Krumholzibacteriia bacterium]
MARAAVTPRLPEAARTGGPAASAFLLTAGLLTVVQLVVERPLLLAERFLPGGGWGEIAVLAGYAAWLAARLQHPGQWARLRPRIWFLFSVVFFGQLTLGLLGVERCLMTGTLHLPVPALVVAGPLYRGEGLFMPILLVSTLVLVGPAWCSWLCYIGAWDNLLARRVELQKPPSPRRREWIRGGLLAAAVGAALLLRTLGVDGVTAAWLAGGFGLAGVGVMAWVSRRRGWMAHCTAYCPLGWLVVRLGRVSPFRLRIRSSCVGCAACRPTCRYGALDPDAWRRQRVQTSCTLCGDCLQTCGALELRWLGLSDRVSRRLLGVLVVSLHAVFLGVARI